jgi:hypothetical protein
MTLPPPHRAALVNRFFSPPKALHPAQPPESLENSSGMNSLQIYFAPIQPGAPPHIFLPAIPPNRPNVVSQKLSKNSGIAALPTARTFQPIPSTPLSVFPTSPKPRHPERRRSHRERRSRRTSATLHSPIPLAPFNPYTQSRCLFSPSRKPRLSQEPVIFSLVSFRLSF